MLRSWCRGRGCEATGPSKILLRLEDTTPYPNSPFTTTTTTPSINFKTSSEAELRPLITRTPRADRSGRCTTSFQHSSKQWAANLLPTLKRQRRWRQQGQVLLCILVVVVAAVATASSSSSSSVPSQHRRGATISSIIWSSEPGGAYTHVQARALTYMLF